MVLEAYEKGFAEGFAKGHRRDVLAMQASGFSRVEIARILKLELSLVENILRSNP